MAPLAEWLAADDPARKQAVVNTVFADPSVLWQRAEDYDHEVPVGVELITIGADVQGDRIEAEVVGWGPNAESWSLDYLVLPGAPTSAEVWDDLLDLYQTDYQTADGQNIRPDAICVDSGAYTQHVYDWCKRVHDAGVIPVKGVAGMGRDQIDGDERQRRKRTAGRPSSDVPQAAQPRSSPKG